MKSKIKGIYRILNQINGKFYIGSTINIKIRWRNHKETLKKNKHRSILLQRAWNKYREENFEFKIMRFVEDSKMIIPIEQFYLDIYRPYDRKIGYNICKRANNTFGRKCSKETKEKIKQKAIGRKQSEESNKKRSIALKGRVISEKTKMKRKLKRIKYYKPVEQYDLLGNFIKKWESISDANRELNINNGHISAVCKGKRNITGGFIWKYKGDKLKLEDHKNTWHKPIKQFTKGGKFIKQYETLKIAGGKTGISSSTICNYLKGRYKNAGVYMEICC